MSLALMTVPNLCTPLVALCCESTGLKKEAETKLYLVGHAITRACVNFIQRLPSQLQQHSSSWSGHTAHMRCVRSEMWAFVLCSYRHYLPLKLQPANS